MTRWELVDNTIIYGRLPSYVPMGEFTAMNLKQRCFSLSKSKAFTLILGCLCFFIFFFAYSSWQKGLLFCVLFCAISFIRFDFSRPIQWTAGILWMLAVVVFLTGLPFYEIFADKMWAMMRAHTNEAALLINPLLILAAIALVLTVTVNVRVSVAVVSFFFSFLVVMNGYIYRFRGKEFIFPDVFAARTALNVADQYEFTMPEHTFTAMAALLFLICICFCFQIPKVKKRIVSLAVCVALSICFCQASGNISIITWKWDGTLMNGYYLNYFISIRDYFVKEPENYSSKYMDQLEEKFAVNDAADTERRPNILVIMNESYADLRVFGSELGTNQPVMPFYDSLSENTVKGYALASVMGGTTANSEFEFLTGFSTQFLPNGSTPYQQYLYDDIFSVVRVLNTYGYECIATHPYLSSGWNRTNAYPAIGFQKSTFLDEYPQEKLIRNFVSDQEMYEYVLSQLQKERENPLFLFGITMQNHGGYSPDEGDFIQTISLEGYSQDYPMAQTYLSLVNQSDAALEYLIGQLENYQEDTVVLFFGDHLPQLDSEFYEELLKGNFDTLDEKQKKYTVPFFIWANFDIEEKNIPCSSLNYLGYYLLECAGLELPPYYRFLREMESVVPAVNILGYYSVENGSFIPVSEATGEELEWLEIYQCIQYNGMFDKNKLSPSFFGNYMG